MTDNEIIKALDILNKMEFFGGQRAGRELWFDKPTDIQNKDIGDFLRDIDFLKNFINRQNAEINQLHVKLDDYERDIVPKLKYSLERANKYIAETDAENIRLLAEREILYENQSN